MANGKPNGNGNGNGRFVATGKTVLLPVGVAAALLVGLWQFDRQQDQQELERAKWEEGVSQRLERLETLEDDVEELGRELAGLEKRLMGVRDDVYKVDGFVHGAQDARIEAARREIAVLKDRLERSQP